MVSNNRDILDRRDAAPTTGNRIEQVGEIITTGEALVTLTSGDVVECHHSDTHIYKDADTLFTEHEDPDGNDAETWIQADEIVMVQRH